MRLLLLMLIGTSMLGTVPPIMNPSTTNVETAQAKDGVRRIRVAELSRLLKDNKAILVDVRTERAYRAGHIKGAILIPVDEIANRISELPKDKLIATYCA